MMHFKAFHDELKNTADEMMRGEHPDYNQANGCVCRVGLTLKKLGVHIHEPADTYRWINEFTGKTISDDTPLHKLYSTVSSRDRDQETGAKGIYRYLKEIEYV